MRRSALLLATVLCILFSTSPLFAADTVRVARVTGVDSFTLDDGTTIGLLGITKPDGKGATTEECIEHLRGLIEGKQVILERDTTVVDTEGKAPQRLVFLDGTLINLQMISDGYARPSSTPHQLTAGFAAAHATARSAGVGAWARPTTHTTESHSSESTSRQCSGTTKKGTRCKRMTTDGSGRCWQH